MNRIAKTNKIQTIKIKINIKKKQSNTKMIYNKILKITQNKIRFKISNFKIVFKNQTKNNFRMLIKTVNIIENNQKNNNISLLLKRIINNEMF